MMKTTMSLLILFSVFTSGLIAKEDGESLWAESRFKGLSLRSLGPAFMSGRIADIAIHPTDDNVWYVGVGSGGVWKTMNAGVTWEPIFDGEKSYSIGCVTIDTQNPSIVWVGTGENVGGRHVGFGDGVYRSADGGKNWKNLGLEKSEHISKILVHPKNSNIVWVASQGPLWKEGGERGVYRTADGGKTWNRVLGDDRWTGATDLALDPRNPDRLYAATWLRHRTVAAYLGGGPGTGLHRSVDGGVTWEKLSRGLPESNMGKIGLALSPQNPDVVYAAIELDRRNGAVYRSTDRGATWEKRSDTVSGGTGPHYYQELYASPHQFDLLYLMDVRTQVSDDGGKTFSRMPEKHKHSDNHAMAFRADDPDYLLVGSDGGLYESFDLAKNWRFVDNLPVTQFYKIALDDSEPFYNVYGGTQDNSTEGGPSRTDNAHGIQNSDWKVVLDWDGHQPATEPGNPNILYAERQEGFLSRIDLSTGEVVDIQPQPEDGEDYERFNWDAPILVSPHHPTRIYFASQRVWRSENRGDQWKPISSDLTRHQERLTLPIMGIARGATPSWDNAWDVSAMSNYNTITSLSESPGQEGLLYAGTDDGLIQVTEDGGAGWRTIEVGSLPNVPPTAFVNDIKADLFRADAVYVALDNHKYGDFSPYLFKSMDRGRTWHSMRANLPERTLVWRIVQDHVQERLFFAGTEFGLYFSVDSGGRWTKLEGGVPTISFRDLAIHRREDDLVGATFGRGLYVFDDLSLFRSISEEQLGQDATLFSSRKAWWYFPRPHLGFEGGKGDQGASHFVASNPPFGAVFTYYLKSDLRNNKLTRQQQEKDQESPGFPGWEKVTAERMSPDPKIWLVVADTDGNVVRRVSGPVTKGFHRVSWDLRYPPPHALPLVQGPPPLWGGPPQGLLAAPGKYVVTLSSQVDGKINELSKPQTFEVVPLRRGALEGSSASEVAGFWRQYESAVRVHSAMKMTLVRLLTKMERIGLVLEKSRAATGPIDEQYHGIRSGLHALDDRLNGNRSRQEVGEKFNPTIEDRLFAVSRGVDRSTYGPTATHRRSLAIAKGLIQELHAELKRGEEKVKTLVQDLVETGAPWIEGEPLPSLDG